jgi:hypothetical protein
MTNKRILKFLRNTAAIALFLGFSALGYYILNLLNFHYFGRMIQRGDALIVLASLPFYSIFQGNLLPLFMLFIAIGLNILGLLVCIFLYEV